MSTEKLTERKKYIISYSGQPAAVLEKPTTGKMWDD
jgi:hypothetical protein